MGRREASRQAKSIFMAYGWSAMDDFEDIQARNEWTDEETDLVHDYYVRVCDRVQEWLGL